MNWLTWILFTGCCLVCFAVGWTARGWRQEVAEFRAETERDAEWDRSHGVRR